MGRGLCCRCLCGRRCLAGSRDGVAGLLAIDTRISSQQKSILRTSLFDLAILEHVYQHDHRSHVSSSPATIKSRRGLISPMLRKTMSALLTTLTSLASRRHLSYRVMCPPDLKDAYPAQNDSTSATRSPACLIYQRAQIANFPLVHHHHEAHLPVHLSLL